jgi:tripartite-type tricarboxylate transporter receptor subunit TctC
MRLSMKAVAAAVAALMSAPALPAESFPSRPVRLIVPFPPGGGTDVFARILGAKLTEMWGQQVVVDNRSGAQGNIGALTGAKSPPDGYTIVLAQDGAFTINPHIYPHSELNIPRDFTAVSLGVTTTSMLSVHPGVPAKTVKELVQVAKQAPGKLTFASTSSSQQLLGELFKMTTGTNILHVPYKGGSLAVTDLLGGNVSMMFGTAAITLAHIKAGKLRPLVVLGNKRSSELPDVPTAAEAGYPALTTLTWYGIVAPAATPPAIVAQLNAAIVRALTAPDVVQRLSAAGQTPAPSTPQEFTTQIRADYDRWGKIVKASGAKVD